MEINKIYNEDCFITMERMDEGMVDLIMTSPFYNSTPRKSGYADTGKYPESDFKDWMSEKDYIDFTVRLFTNFDRIVKKNSVVIYNFSYSIENPSLPYKLVNAICEHTKWSLADTVVWKKASGIPFPANERRLSRNWEFVWIFVRKDEIDTFKCYKGVKSVNEKTGQKYYNVFYNLVEAKNNDAKTHSLNQATYSTELCLKLFNIYADKDNKEFVVYDPFMGTGTTANAAKEYGISYIGSEISTKQCEYAENRLKS